MCFPTSSLTSSLCCVTRATPWRLSSVQPAAKQRGALMTEVAAAKAMSGEHDEAFHLASNALTVGVTYGSERVIQRARRFRRTYDGPVTAGVRAFDERLRATLL